MVSGILPQAVNLARKPISLTLIGPSDVDEQARYRGSLNFLSTEHDDRNYWLRAAVNYQKSEAIACRDRRFSGERR